GTYSYTINESGKNSTVLGGPKCRITGSWQSARYGIYVESGKVEMTINNVHVNYPYSGSGLEIAKGAEVVLTLEGENSFKVYNRNNIPGISVPEGAALTITGTGSLEAEGQAGIGSKENVNSGVIRILNGDITATGDYGAGIGGGRYGSNGTIQISGGKVNAKSTWSGAGIGGGVVGKGGIIEISGGEVIAEGEESGAGIGCGSRGGSGGQITISGGNVTAISDLEAGIGGGDLSSSGTITITGGVVHASSARNSAGIGGGYYGAGETIKLLGGDITATSAGSAAIGGGSDAKGGSVTIGANAIVTAEGFTSAIGGYGTDNKLGCDSISIDRRAVTHLSNKNNNANNCIENIKPEHPQTAAGETGSAVAFSTKNSYGYSGLKYQWQVSADQNSWNDLAGKTAAVLNVTLSEQNDGSYYRCKLTNGWGNVIYTNAARGFIINQPETIRLREGETEGVLDASSQISGLTYQWEVSTDFGEHWDEIAGANDATLTVSGKACDTSDLYRCKITVSKNEVLYSDIAGVYTAHTEVIDAAELRQLVPKPV
ncbi:MAG: hypothetical protein Q4B09_09745, partial [Lachnospiraceae bacterium]|nr:hypothetical protein [Lachnospiraceae bacterium]